MVTTAGTLWRSGTGLTAGKVKSGRHEGVGASQRAALRRPARGPAAQPRKHSSTRCGHEDDSDTLCNDSRTGRRAWADPGELLVRSNSNGSRGAYPRVSVLRAPGRGEPRCAQVLLSQRGMTEQRLSPAGAPPPTRQAARKQIDTTHHTLPSPTVRSRCGQILMPANERQGAKPCFSVRCRLGRDHFLLRHRHCIREGLQATMDS